MPFCEARMCRRRANSPASEMMAQDWQEIRQELWESFIQCEWSSLASLPLESFKDFRERWNRSVVIEAALFGLLGVLVGGLLTYHASSLSRNLELYKIVFPEKFARASEMMATARELAREVEEYYDLEPGTTIPNPTRRVLRLKLNDFANFFESSSWLFGDEVAQAVKELDHFFSKTISDIDGWQAEWSQYQRVEALKKMSDARVAYRSESGKAIGHLAKSVQKEIRVRDFPGL